MEPDSKTLVALEVQDRWGLSIVKYLGGTRNSQWLVDNGTQQLVLRRYSAQRFPDPDYELMVLRLVADAGWPVPRVVVPPTEISRELWSLVTACPGESRRHEGPAERQARGRLLASFHSTTSSFVSIGQREGFSRSDEGLLDAELDLLLERYEPLFPWESRALRWHLDWCRSQFQGAPLDELSQVVLHSDFAPWNLLYTPGGELSGIVDFDATHINYRIAEFALAWRGDEDEVIQGYEEVQPLTSLERRMLLPIYWGWLFLDIKPSLRDHISGQAAGPHFGWQMNHFAKRSPNIAPFAPTYPGPLRL